MALQIIGGMPHLSIEYVSKRMRGNAWRRSSMSISLRVIAVGEGLPPGLGALLEGQTSPLSR